MSKRKKKVILASQGRRLPPPSFGALMRMTWQHVRRQLLKTIHEAGFPEFQNAHFAVFSFPLPEGVRPSEIAHQKNMSRQAINYILVQFEGLGYVERRTVVEGDADRRLVYMTEQSYQIADAIHACLQRLHHQWSKEVGTERFEVFVDVLKHLAARAQEKDANER